MKTSEKIRAKFCGNVFPNRAQAKSLVRIMRRHGDNVLGISQVHYLGIIGVQVNRMYIGIEPDGYAHT